MKTSLPGRSLVAGVLTTMLAFAVTAPPTSSLRAAEHERRAEAKAGSFASPADAWKAVQDAVTEIETLVTAKNLKPVHESQEKLAAALTYLHDNPGAVADKGRFTGAVKNAITASDKLHDASDAGDQAKTESTLKTLKATLSLVQKQLPAAGAR